MTGQYEGLLVSRHPAHLLLALVLRFLTEIPLSQYRVLPIVIKFF